MQDGRHIFTTRRVVRMFRRLLKACEPHSCRPVLIVVMLERARVAPNAPARPAATRIRRSHIATLVIE